MYVPMNVPAQDPSDTEAFLESTDREVAAAHGGNTVQSRRALGLAASALGLVACAVALWSRRELHATTSAHLERLAMKTVADKCSIDGVNCETSRCCEHPESTCYKKNDHWASCNHTCSPKMKWVENAWQEQEEPVWDCGVLSSEEEQKEPACTASGEDCSTSKCCSETGMTCFKKNDHWSSCNHTCSPKMKFVENAWQEQEEPVWDCGVLSSEEKKEEPVCSASGEDCSTSKCCSAHGMTCFKKNDHWSSCNHTCSPKMKWVQNAWQEQEEPVWDCGVLSSEEEQESACSASGEDCLTSKCCSETGMTCTRNARECRGDDRMCCVL